MATLTRRSPILGACALVIASLPAFPEPATPLRISEHETLEAQGLTVLLYHNAFHGVFSDQKLSGIEIIQQGERIATNGDVRLLATPEQWDPVPRFEGRSRLDDPQRLEARCSYPDEDLAYRLEVAPEGEGFRVAVHLDRALPAGLRGRAGFNLELLPSAYFGKSYVMGDSVGVFPRHPHGPMRRDPQGEPQAVPLASGTEAVLSPEDPLTRVKITSDTGPIVLLDGRARAQNGWFVVRALLPGDRTDNAIVWHVRPQQIPGWTRPPVVAFNQAGYTPSRAKVAVIELDPAFDGPPRARVLRIDGDGTTTEAFEGPVTPWGSWLRYEYAHFDFSDVRAPGLYAIEYAGARHGPFRVAEDVYAQGVWQPSLDTFLPIQMDHVKVREAYRVWHGVSHLDDARQAPAHHEHFDGYGMGATMDSPFEAGEHIPGLDVGGWYDAGDFDIRTESQAMVVTDLVLLAEVFGVSWDETTIDQAGRSVEIRRPDGISDVVQQVEHGALALLAQYRVFGHAIHGIVAPTLAQYTFLGDAGSKTDNRIYDGSLDPSESRGDRSGVPDDRWAFTTRTTPLDYAVVAALAAASRVLRGHDDALADECLTTAKRVWTEEQGRAPVVFRSFNTTGGPLEVEEVKATVELLIASGGAHVYRERLTELLPAIEARFMVLGEHAVRALPHMDEAFKKRIASAVRTAKRSEGKSPTDNPFGVPIMTEATWGGARIAARSSFQAYLMHKAFPSIVGADSVLDGFDYVLGRHPASNVSFVSGVGTRSQLVAYGFNRADYAFIPGGLVPGIIVVQPDFPETKSDWPFLWFENEYVITAATAFMLAANAVQAVAQ